MNFLAHLYLSGDDKDIMIGNFIADSVKGKAYLKYRNGIQHGILLHRKIDELTDNHRITKDLSNLFKSHFHRYSGIIIDVFYDHFLCKNWDNYSEISLKSFIKKSHGILLKNIRVLPPQVQGFLPIMIAKNRLYSYSKIEGLKDALERMAQYTSLPEGSDFAIATLKNNYEYFNQQFLIFFDEMIESVAEESKLIAKQHFA